MNLFTVPLALCPQYWSSRTGCSPPEMGKALGCGEKPCLPVISYATLGMSLWPAWASAFPCVTQVITLYFQP
jgi:hypothetical protein